MAERTRVTAATKQAVLELVPRTQARTAGLRGWTLRRIRPPSRVDGGAVSCVAAGAPPRRIWLTCGR